MATTTAANSSGAGRLGDTPAIFASRLSRSGLNGLAKAASWASWKNSRSPGVSSLAINASLVRASGAESRALIGRQRRQPLIRDFLGDLARRIE